MQSREELHQLQCEDRRKAGLLYVVVALQPDNCLGDASNNSRPTTRHQVDPLLNIRRPRLCLRPGLALAHTPAYARENIPAMHLCRQQVGVKVSQKKTKVMMLNVSNPAAVKVNGEDLPTTEGFTSFGSTVRHDGAPQIATSGIASVRTERPSEC